MAVIAGARRLNVTKQEALRSKGLFKIAPPSKVCTEEIKIGSLFYVRAGCSWVRARGRCISAIAVLVLTPSAQR